MGGGEHFPGVGGREWVNGWMGGLVAALSGGWVVWVAGGLTAVAWQLH